MTNQVQETLFAIKYGAVYNTNALIHNFISRRKNEHEEIYPVNSVIPISVNSGLCGLGRET